MTLQGERERWQNDRATTLTRRQAVLLVGAALAAPRASLAQVGGPERRSVPRTGERLPALGLGTWRTFDTPPQGAEFDAAVAALGSFLDGGGRVVDTSPMYGRAEARIGEMLAEEAGKPAVFLATKVWTRGLDAGRQQLADSLRLLGRPTLDLVQVHNLLDVDVHWPALQAAREAGRVRYLGITHHQAAAHTELERVMRSVLPDFVQVNYSLAEPEAGARLLSVARDLGIAVLVNRPFSKGTMIDRARDRPLPAVATDLACRSAAQMFVKWVLGHPAVTVALVGTRNARHATENLQAATPPFPDELQRRAIASWFEALPGR